MNQIGSIEKLKDGSTYIWKFHPQYFGFAEPSTKECISPPIMVQNGCLKSEWEITVALNAYSTAIDIFVELISMSTIDVDTLFQVTVSAAQETCTKKILPDVINNRIKFFRFYSQSYFNPAANMINIVVNFGRSNDTTSITNDFAKILASKAFSDVTIVAADGTEFKAHKVVLCARSEVFAAMFCTDCLETNTKRITIEDMNADIVEEMLNYMYTNQIMANDMASDLFAAANKYALLDLQRMCESILMQAMEVNSAADIFVLADRHANEGPKTRALQFIAENINAVIKTDGWKRLRQMDRDLCIDILEKSHTGAVCEA